MNPQKQTMNTINSRTVSKRSTRTIRVKSITIVMPQRKRDEIDKKMNSNTIDIISNLCWVQSKTNKKNGSLKLKVEDYEDYKIVNNKIKRIIPFATKIANVDFEHCKIQSFKYKNEELKKKGFLSLIDTRKVLLEELTDEEIHLSGVKFKNEKYEISHVNARESIKQIKYIADLLGEVVELTLKLKEPVEDEDGNLIYTVCFLL
jgi:hypothetical protein